MTALLRVQINEAGLHVFPWNRFLSFLLFLLEECAGVSNKFSRLGYFQSFGETVGFFIFPLRTDRKHL